MAKDIRGLVRIFDAVGEPHRPPLMIEFPFGGQPTSQPPKAICRNAEHNTITSEVMEYMLSAAAGRFRGDS
ncbi:hypothetical protein X743_03195 [Mesorhizobium sp. LNHC252B00]|nr:hypothetical protein X743_03195 [Mesorhizobium sp. LNHC252B00]